MLINIIIKWIHLDQIPMMQIDPKTIYQLNRFCKIMQIWSKHNLTLSKLVKNILD